MIAQRCAADNADHLAYLLQLSELELIERERKAAERRLKAARFPAAKLLEAKEERQLLRYRQTLNKLDLLVLDELRYVPASKT